MTIVKYFITNPNDIELFKHFLCHVMIQKMCMKSKNEIRKWVWIVKIHHYVSLVYSISKRSLLIWQWNSIKTFNYFIFYIHMIESPMSLFVWLNVISIISGFIAGNHNRLRMSFCHENQKWNRKVYDAVQCQCAFICL